MRLHYLLAIIIFLPSVAGAQAIGGAGIDLSPYALRSQVPQPAGSAPVPPSGAGSIGTPGFYTPPDAAQKVAVQRTTVNTDSSGLWSITWATAFVSSTPTVNPIPLNASAANPYVCNVTSRSATAAAGKCWQTTSNNNAILSLNISLAPSVAPVSTPVMIIGAEPTQ